MLLLRLWHSLDLRSFLFFGLTKSYLVDGGDTITRTGSMTGGLLVGNCNSGVCNPNSAHFGGGRRLPAGRAVGSHSVAFGL